jgi:hypothetical protein
MTPNPKIAAEQLPPQEAQDYPRWTESMAGILAGIRKFRDELIRTRP